MHNQDWFVKEGLKVLRSFPVLWSGWELDNEWYLCERENGERVLVISDHGYLRIDTSANKLQQKIDEYKGVLAESEEIMRILKGN